MRWLAISLAVTLSALARGAELVPADVMLASPHDGDPFTIAESGRLSITVGHAFSQAEVIQRISYLLAYWKKRFNIASEWRGNRVFLSGAIYGIKIEALFAVSESSVTGFARDPGWPWRGQVMGYVDRKLKKYLHPTYDDP